MSKRCLFKYFKTSVEIICIAVMLYVRFPLSLRNVEDLLHDRGTEVSHETVRLLVAAFWADVCIKDQKAPDRRLESLAFNGI